MPERDYADQALALQALWESEHARKNAAERILAEIGDWQYTDDSEEGEVTRCIACDHSVPRHAARCPLLRLALRCAEAEAR
jgi:hypothetical protein